jgi:hypothetical protein
VGGSRGRRHVLLGQVELEAPFADVGADPVPLAQLTDRGVLLAGAAMGLAAAGTIACRLDGGPAFGAMRLSALSTTVSSYRFR